MNMKKICILGLGYIGLPTAAMFATHGHKIIGVDIREDIVSALNIGETIIHEPYLDILVQAAVTSGNLVAKLHPEEADVFIIAVPTPITEDKKADMSYVISATEAIVPHLRNGNIVVLESTSPVGTVKDLMCPILAESGLRIGRDLFVAHSPERVLPGQILMELVNNNRIIGGINRESAEIVRELYKTFVKGEIYLTDATTAEMCKMMENTYRDVNIALANELLKICDVASINVWEVISLCNKHPRVNIHQPGPGVGGHCLAVDPWFIVERFPNESTIIKTSRLTNDSMPQYVMKNIQDILDDIPGKKVITILGATYKPDVDDIRESPIIHLIDLIEKGINCEIRIYDPYISGMKGQERDLKKAVTGSDLIVLGVNHTDFKRISYKEISKLMRNTRILDTRDCLDKESLIGNGFSYFLLGSYFQSTSNTIAKVISA